MVKCFKLFLICIQMSDLYFFPNQSARSLEAPPPPDLCSNHIVCVTFTEIRTCIDVNNHFCTKKEKPNRNNLQIENKKTIKLRFKCTTHKLIIIIIIISLLSLYTSSLSLTNKNTKLNVFLELVPLSCAHT